MTGVMCPCGDFPAGDPSDAHSVQHTAWLNRSEPGTSVLGESTSARLRRVEQERDEARATLAVRTGQLHAAREHVSEAVEAEECALEAEKRARVQRDAARAELKQVTQERQYRSDMLGLVRAELASARAELEQLRVRHTGGLAAGRAVADELDRLRSSPGWIVARDGGRDCVRCDGEITRGQAYELVNLSDLQHIFCDDKEAS